MKLAIMALALAPTFYQAPSASPAAARPAPTLRIEKAFYTLDPGVLQVAFTFTNPTDSVLFLDCQGRPKSDGRGGVLHLALGNPEDTSADPAAIPSRVGPHQVFTAARKLYAKAPGREDPSIALDPVPFGKVQMEIAWYPERREGEGAPYLKERAAWVSAKAVAMEKRGKRPPPPSVRKTRTYVPGEAPKE